MQLIDEEWAPIPGLENSFQVSNLGRVRSLDRMIEFTKLGRTVTRPAKGKLFVTENSTVVRLPLNNNQDTKFFIDELVIQSFTDIQFDEWKIIKHLDDDCCNNELSNLEVIDPFCNSDEVWKDVTGWEGIYKVSDKGQLIKCPIHYSTKKGQPKVSRCMFIQGLSLTLTDPVSGRSQYIDRQRIVAQAFMQEDLAGIRVLHRDKDMHNNAVDNLQLVSDSDGCYVKVDDADCEEWRPVVGYEDRYEVSNYGNVRSIGSVVECGNQSTRFKRFYPGKVLMQGDNDGYKLVYLRGSTKLVHRLVAQAFIPNPENKPEVNHKDRDHSNNHISNLEWVTKEENTQHLIDSGYDFGSSRRGKHNSPYWYEQMKNVKHVTTPELRDKLRNSHSKQSKPCRCIETGQKFNSIAAAARHVKCDSTTLAESIKQHRKVKGYTFELIEA